MSTPSGKPSYPIELSDYLAHKPRERDEAEPDPVESGQETFRSPYAPKSAHPGAEPAPSIAKHDLTGSVSDYAPKRAQPEAAASFAPPDAAVGAEQRGSEPAGHILDPDPAISLQPRQATDGRQGDQAGGESRDAGIDDRDLERLENSVRWLQRRQAAAMRLPRAPGLSLPPLRPALPTASVGSPVGGDGRERAADAMRSSLRSLEPTRLTPPSLGSDRNPNTMLAVAVVCTFMAGVVVYLLLASRSPPSQSTSKADMTAVEPRPSPSGIETEATVWPERRWARAPDVEPPAEAANALAAAAPSAIPAQQEKAAMLRPAPAEVQSPPAVRTLDPQEISLLINQGEKHVAVGDLAAARTVFQRAAQAGDATAALALAATYDPNVLARLGVLGMGTNADAEKARTWYRTAEGLGSPEATLRLQALDRR
jgi:hypothetical protein